MERISAGEAPASEIQKFVQVHNNQELHITACAVSQNVDLVLVLNDNFLIEPNQQWAEWAKDVMKCFKESSMPDKPERAWVKIYYNLYGKADSVSKTSGQVQIIKLPMRFLGESHKECWGEIQIRMKQKDKDIKLGRHTCFDTRVGKWIEETKLIAPKKDAGAHSYVALRLYHQNYLPEGQLDWHFEPVYAAIAGPPAVASEARPASRGGKDFYRINAVWKGEEIIIAVEPLDPNSLEIPNFLR